MSENLVVASKIKTLIKKKANMNTSSTVMDALSKVVETQIDDAIDKARREGRKTVMDRDFTLN